MRKSFIMYAEWADQILSLPNDLAGEYAKAILNYAIYGEKMKIDNPALKAMLIPVYKRIDVDLEAWEETKRQRSEAGKKGMAKRWNNKTITNDNDVITNDNTVIADYNEQYQDITKITVNVNDNVNVNDKDIKEKNNKKKSFVKPTVEEVKAYCQERGNKVDPYQFVDFYESKGWKVGNQSMKDWKAAVRTWEKRDTEKTGPKKFYYKGRDYDFKKIEGELLGNVRQG